MNARKFIAGSSREALKLVRIELGEDAVILSNRKVAEGVEIVAILGSELAHLNETRVVESRASSKPRVDKRIEARPGLSDRAQNQASTLGAKILAAETQRAVIPAPVAVQAAEEPAEQQRLLSELKSMHKQMQEQMATLAWGNIQQQDPKRSGLMRDMVNVGFSPALSRRLLDKMPANADLNWVKRILAHNLRVAGVQDDVVTRGGVYALVGPTGVGKTTTTAKLAARAVVRYGADKVALVTTDSYRVGAYEQLRIYAKILGVTVHAVRDANDLKLTLSGLKHKHLVLIDTMGVGQRDSRVAEQTRMFDEAGIDRLLLLNATSAGGTLDDVVKMYGGPGVIGCIPTKLDEAVTLGTVLDVVARHKLAMHYIASGQRVPEDLHEVKLDYLLHRTFKDVGKASNFALPEMDFPAFMAGLTSGVAAGREYAH
ncbi:MAG: flagellar biosynthesis protein FlhF [Gammaproteobacteria bacterium]|nr:flagellar biosynthesis protein FlhF [Gammaproteobacteria bacterium]MBU1625522.1 flagellar biosynthesis protein FlhF [Gammaproteobacteria bacterium]MBU1980782.1 flagellar biosynthesis protein FlhF [Gammaproteobacteria bacterium]